MLSTDNRIIYLLVMTIVNQDRMESGNNELTRIKAKDDIFWEKARHDGIPIPVIRAGGGQRLRRTKPQSSSAGDGEGKASASSVRIIRTTRRATTSNNTTSMTLTRSVLFLIFFWSFILPRMKKWIVECCRDISAVKRSFDAQSSRRKSNRIINKATTSTVCIVILLLTYNTIDVVVADRDIPSDFFKQPIIKKKNIWQRLRKRGGLGKQVIGVRDGGQGVHSDSGGIQIRSNIITKSSTMLIRLLSMIGIGYLIWLLVMQHRGMKRWISEQCRYNSERIHSSGTSTSRGRRRVQKRGESRTNSSNGQLTPSSSVMEIINLIEEDSDNDVDRDCSPLVPAISESFLLRRNSSFLSMLPFSSVRKRSTILPSTVDVFDSIDSDMGMVDSSRPLSNCKLVSRDEHAKSFSTVISVTAYPHQQRRTSIDTEEDETSQITVVMSITIDQGKRGHDDDQKTVENNSALAKKLSTGSSRVRLRR